MASSYASTPETTNANRACRVVLGPCTDGLRDTLRHYVPPPSFPHIIKQNERKLPRLTAVQRDLILPRHGSYTGNYDDMDISLLYILLRNITGISPHSKGWGNDPDPRDTSLSANIEIIRLARNRCVHCSVPFMSNTDFNSIWSTIRSVMVDLDDFLGNGKKYEKAVDFLRHESMDPEHDLHYEEKLRKQVEEDTKTREMVVKLENEMKKLTKSPIPPNVREQYNIDIQKWREEDKLYYETHSFPSVMEKVRNQPYVTFVGVSGSGKSATAHHIALKLQEEGYEVVPTKDVRKMEDYGDPRNPQVFVIDDVVGVFGLQKTKLDVLINYEQKITEPCMVKSKTLMTCREAVFNEMLPNKPFLTKEETVIRLHSSDKALDNNDKKQILRKYGLNVNLISSTLLKLTSYMFPFLCKLFSKDTKFQALGSKFFLNPVQCIIDELNDMQRENKLNYATLVLCMLNENSLSKDIFKHEKFIDKKNNTLENCRLELNTDTFKFMDALSAMEKTYTKQCGAQYTFIHDSMFEICAYQYGKQFPEQILLYMSSSYIANYVKPQTSEPANDNQMKEKRSDFQSIEGDDDGRNDSDGKEKESESQSIEGGEGSSDSDGKEKQSESQSIEGGEGSSDSDGKEKQSESQSIEGGEGSSDSDGKEKQSESQSIEGGEGSSDSDEKENQSESQSIEGGESSSDSDEKENQSESQSIEGGEGSSDSDGKEKESESQSIEGGEGSSDSDGKEKENVYKNNEREISSDLCIRLREDLYPLLAERLYRDIQNMELYDVFRNQVLKHPQVCQAFIDVLETKSYTELKFLFLSSQENVDKIVSKQKCVVRESWEWGEWEIQKMLVDETYKQNMHIGDDENEYMYRSSDERKQEYTYNVRVIGWVIYNGHHHILQFIVQQSEQHEDISELFRITGNTPYQSKSGIYTCTKQQNKTDMLQEQIRLLVLSCYSGDVQTVRVLLHVCEDACIHFNSIYMHVSPLVVACEGGHVNIVKELVKAGVDVNGECRRGDTPLIAACTGGHLSVVKELVKAGVDVNPKDRHINSALMTACYGGHASVVRELVKAGTHVNLQDEWWDTPLIKACFEGHVSVVKKLVKAGAEVNLQNKHGNTPLIAACIKGHVGTVGPYAPQRVKRNKSSQLSTVKELVKAESDVNLQNEQGNTPLITACEGGHASVVEELLKAGADVSLENDMGIVPLVSACERGHVIVVKKLIKAGVDVNLHGKFEKTPLIAACDGGHVSMVQKLVKAGADVNLQVYWGDKPLLQAVRYCPLSTVKCLVEHGADWDTQVPDVHVSAVYRALILNKPDIVKYLIQKQNKITPGKFNGNLHLFNCLVDIRHAGVKTDSRDDVVVTDTSVWCMDKLKDDWNIICGEECDVLRNMLCVGLDANQRVQLYNERNNDRSDIRPLLYTLIDEWGCICFTKEKARVLLEAGPNFNVRVRYREHDSVLDREGVSVLERIRQNTSIRRDKMCEIKKHVRRHSV
ncbi:uncharacterized protein LOC125671725 [Ostrea edulis]|uniref:uncharacterized protein LOC125671725 n=1 Tax=Ostrea edulis TaxID=37623 RepID=UPI0024AF1340|nr:uncharacterized protein LOC125671725 [Ostrea edulis]